ncbi:BTAD domain-containing putative transcriptional regulator [Streptomyces sp. AK08-02]|uniref:BTAD domain-containing putative transcriptional regulator n=1 Tax=Streptomyces sp. AK08-02 TaxID=3028654 RepID=UPI0029BAA105|nr:BTAD domain-containing putative transcriptional regulator [Streptomyces sp. AK08-02]MDX3753458.1 BTAD domain-containing putative transcriptional regulator [Streptomyces sp. AK08-02]
MSLIVHRDIATIVRTARVRRGVSQRAVAERSGLSLRTLREIEQGRVRAPRASSLQRLAEVLDEPVLFPDPAPAESGQAAYAADEPLALQILGRLAVRRGTAEVTAGTPKQQRLLGLLALRVNQTVDRDEITDILWGDDIPDSFGQLIHTYVYRIRQLLETHTGDEAPPASLMRRSSGYELLVPEAEQLDLLRFRRSAALAAQEREAERPEREAALLEEALTLWRGPVLQGMGPGLMDHPVAVEARHQRVTSALRLADLVLPRGPYEGVIDHLGPVARDNPLHEGVHARLVSALAGSGQRAAALELFAAVDRRLRNDSGIGAGDDLRRAQSGILCTDEEAVPRPAARRTAGEPVRPFQMPRGIRDYVDRPEQQRILHHLTGRGPQVAFGAAPVAALYGPVGVGKSTLAARVAASSRPTFRDGVLHGELHTGAPEEVRLLLGRFLTALGVPAEAVPEPLPARAALYRGLLAKRQLLVVLDLGTGEQAVRPFAPGGNSSALLVCSREPLSGLEGARHFRITPFDADQAAALLSSVLGEGRVDAERGAADRIAALCGGLPMAVRVAGMRLAVRPHWPLSRLAERLEDPRRRLDELVMGDLHVAERIARALPEPGSGLGDALSVLVGTAGSFTIAATSRLLGCSPREAEDLLETLVDRQILEGPARSGGEYAFLPLTRLAALRREVGVRGRAA